MKQLINYLMALLVLSSFLPHIAQGIRLGKVAISTRNHDHQDMLKISSVKESVQHDELLLPKSDIFAPFAGINRKLMTKITSSLTTTNDSENDHQKKNEQDPKPQVMRSTHQLAGNEKEETLASDSSLENSKHRVVTEQYESDTDIGEMDYTPARKKSPIHN